MLATRDHEILWFRYCRLRELHASYTMASEFELIKLLAWGALLYLVSCFFHTFASLVVPVNAVAFIGSTVWIVSEGEGTPYTTRQKRDEELDSRRSEEKNERADFRNNSMLFQRIRWILISPP
ncbi:hypothetical protein K491DRAFT_520270 [Lophiostoma macrostomum CBS 122681]|uniref:Uncharacterized protein n=1 Tax=Lophiostoma macrostomum CBS 122681 TaxID=1314788 RepID=A0A6A6T030_9PLEO|nr:hypothetical protein K491DRAFT_520270 [Lophiostoma macrostomum CBS 122681]